MARSFNGSTDIITLPTTTTQFGQPMTIAGWFKCAAFNGGFNAIFMKDNQSVNGKFWGLTVLNTGGSNQNIDVRNDGGGIHGSTQVLTGTWYHGLGTTDAGGNTNVYLNGVNDGGGSSSAGNPTTGSAFIGNDTVQTYPFNGSIADVGVWNVVLTQLEITALASGVRPYLIRPASLAGWWPVDGIQSPEPDLSGNKNNGTLTGTALTFGPPMIPFTPRRQLFVEVPPRPSMVFGYTVNMPVTITATISMTLT